MPDPVSRRTVAIALAGGALGAKLASLDAPATIDAQSSIAGAEAGAPPERTLLSPLTEGSRLLDWEVVAIEPKTLGAARVQLRGGSDIAFAVEILARDPSPLAPRPPAATGQFALFVSNGGHGHMPTAEEQGLAAMALAQIVERNEHAVSTDGFLTHAERIAVYPMALLDHVDGSSLEGPIDPHIAEQLAPRSLAPTDPAVAERLVPHVASQSSSRA
ncbi:MAG: hypothetical protein R3B70_22270 [Polyangiaceae bacterium]